MAGNASPECTSLVCVKKMKLSASSEPEIVVVIVASENNDQGATVSLMQEPASLRRKRYLSRRGRKKKKKKKILAMKVVNTGSQILNDIVSSVPVEVFINKTEFIYTQEIRGMALHKINYKLVDYCRFLPWQICI